MSLRSFKVEAKKLSSYTKEVLFNCPIPKDKPFLINKSNRWDFHPSATCGRSAQNFYKRKIYTATCKVNPYMKNANFHFDVSKNSFLLFCMFLEVPVFFFRVKSNLPRSSHPVHLFVHRLCSGNCTEYA